MAEPSPLHSKATGHRNCAFPRLSPRPQWLCPSQLELFLVTMSAHCQLCRDSPDEAQVLMPVPALHYLSVDWGRKGVHGGLGKQHKVYKCTR